MSALKYPATLSKLALTRDEIKDLTASKLKAILDGNSPNTKLNDALNQVTSLLALRTTTRDKNLDQRQKTTAIPQYLASGAIRDQFTSPQKAASQGSEYVEKQSKGYHDEQAKLISLLMRYSTAFDDLKVQDGILKRTDDTLVPAAEFCNIFDEITKTFLFETDIQDRSITSGRRDRDEISKIYDSCINVAAGRIAVSSTFDDDILNKGSYEAWAKHVNIIASFAALAVALKKLH